jgi:hypothetical protein
MAVAQGYGKTVTSGSVFAYDTGDTRNSFIGEPTVNAISNANTMASWTNYYRTVASSTFTTEFGTTGYRFVNQPSWNGIYRNFNLGSSGFYTFSAWFKYNGGSAANNGATVYISNYGGGDTLAALDKTKVGIWQRVTFTVNVTSPSNVYFYLISYGGTDNGTGNPDFSSWEVTMPQVELNSHATPFVAGTRSATQGLLPLVGNSTIDLSSMSFTSNAQMTFDGTDDGIIISDSQYNKTDGQPLTVEVVMKPGRNAGQYQDLVVNRSDGLYNWMLYQHTTDGSIQMHGAAQNKSSYIPTIGQNIHVVATITSGQVSTLYVNGVVQQVVSGFTYAGMTPSLLCIGVFGTGRYEPYLGTIDVTKIYNRALSAGEVRQNYLHYKTRFNLS